ncbi:transporter substrate-binding domain-containing protein [Pelagibius sp.]|uniref:transporter substrate-binding domain-containing protein n=1 Tax=Pelagibius sp. TaxID=1931238 RepID=UPI0026196CBB|nr:transporter substrate-binding domain-containing protein [Pelagibius sp.]
MKQVKFILAALLAAGLAWAEPAAAQDSTLTKVLESGKLRVGTTGDWNPMSMKDPASGGYAGFDIDVMTELAKDLGVEVEFVPTEWKTLVPGIVADKYDISTSASITAQRIRSVGFTESYYQLGTVPLTQKKNAERFKSWEDINQSDVTVAVTLGTSQEQQVKTLFPNATVRTIEAPARDFQEVLAGRADVSVTSNVEASKLIEAHDSIMIVPVDKPASPADIAFLVDQNDQIWLNYLNHWIQIKKNKGFFQQVQDKWIPAN